ncbi:MAG TPA: GH25 family lysozyme [Clostridia bacterium]|nr:GH25 family lysozyme [Clostridia bacterium]
MKKKLFASLYAAAIMAAALFLPVSATAPNGAVNLRGIDISEWQTVTDWASVENSVDFVYIRATLGQSYVDQKLASHVAGVKSSGKPYGFYHFFYASLDSSYVRSEARNFYNAIKRYSYILTPVLDVETQSPQTRECISSNIKIFADEFYRLSGQKIMIYASPSFVNNYFDKSLSAYKYWEAHYTTASQPMNTTVWNKYDLWQYSSSGIVSGISGRVDMDRATRSIYLAATSGTASACKSGDVYRVSKMPYVWNSKAKSDFSVLYSNGSRAVGHKVSRGDRICILGVDYSRQLAEIVYPVKGGYMHGYIKNTESLLSNRYYNKWRNGSTSETVYNAAGQITGRIYPYERATIIYKKTGLTEVLYSTAKGAETKSGFVRFGGVR